ncbi:unnamed protein product [Moneuplotes crassus]|uniref:Uncharacterized protein n=1 Tax=Euplotes crassus TaxID=5936 RepID=A0AAD1YDG6_EUPCR|nr:unnamed protein product [Moneuplotes crassus]
MQNKGVNSRKNSEPKTTKDTKLPWNPNFDLQMLPLSLRSCLRGDMNYKIIYQDESTSGNNKNQMFKKPSHDKRNTNDTANITYKLYKKKPEYQQYKHDIPLKMYRKVLEGNFIINKDNLKDLEAENSNIRRSQQPRITDSLLEPIAKTSKKNFLRIDYNHKKFKNYDPILQSLNRTESSLTRPPFSLATTYNDSLISQKFGQPSFNYSQRGRNHTSHRLSFQNPMESLPQHTSFQIKTQDQSLRPRHRSLENKANYSPPKEMNTFLTSMDPTTEQKRPVSKPKKMAKNQRNKKILESLKKSKTLLSSQNSLTRSQRVRNADSCLKKCSNLTINRAKFISDGTQKRVTLNFSFLNNNRRHARRYVNPMELGNKNVITRRSLEQRTNSHNKGKYEDEHPLFGGRTSPKKTLRKIKKDEKTEKLKKFMEDFNSEEKWNDSIVKIIDQRDTITEFLNSSKLSNSKEVSKHFKNEIQFFRKKNHPIKINNKKAFSDYYEQCTSEYNPALRILTHINKNALSLCDYLINMGNAKAFKNTCIQSPLKIKRIYLVNNCMSDSILKKILEGALHLKDLHTLVIGRNEVGKESLEIILELLPKLNELRLNQLKYHPSVLDSVISQIHSKKISLKKLSLRSNNLDNKTVEILCKMLKSNKSLTHFDVASNKMLTHKNLKIFSALEKASEIQDFNISCNSLPDFNIFKFRPISVFLSSGPIKIKASQFNPSGVTNSNLIHLNMSYMNLSFECGAFLLKCVSRSESLLSVHLSGNEELLKNRDKLN